MGFETPKSPLSDYLTWTSSGRLQLPDFQREYKWEDERIRSLLVTVLRGHPMGAVMLLETGSDQVRFKPKPVSGTSVAQGAEPKLLLLDGQQRLTSLTQALTGDGIVHTKDDKKKLFDRRYYVDMALAVQGDEFIDESVKSVPGDGKIKTNFDRDIVLDLSTPALEQQQAWFPLRLLFAGYDQNGWLYGIANQELAKQFMELVLKPTATYQIPAIQLGSDTSKSAVATVFEKVNTGGVPLNVFELLTATFAGDKAYFDQHGDDFRLNDDWTAIQDEFRAEPVLTSLGSTDFLQAATLLTTWKRNRDSTAERKPAISAKRDDILKLQLTDYLEWRGVLVKAFEWTAVFVADLHIFEPRFMPYPTQLVPLAVTKVILDDIADNHGVKERLKRWYWCGILGELYGSATETRFARDVEQLAEWARDTTSVAPRTVSEALFQERRLYTLKTRQSAAYKGIYALIIGTGAKDWIKDVTFSRVQYKTLQTDIHHIFPEKWSKDRNLDRSQWDSIINKTPLAAATNRAIGGVAPTEYLPRVQSRSQLDITHVDRIIATHGIDTNALRNDDFEAHFAYRKNFLIGLIEGAMGKPVVREQGAVDVLAVAAEYEVEVPDDRPDSHEESLAEGA
ncbi:DUF262 domain-containing protein [Raineyella sp. LH-20]|uniref:GmrSD restriction endonuclease domain-containing protein n=1 Tax=Raineyella sp. LH-20 TaxID=3081204 RepID=UPI002952CDDE|nr:DUF262 domain-containing protein [Raineyella sp. LH-20]WOP19533.1 DUF262 domain-containing protein [Raineyella sp. LH-20]